MALNDSALLKPNTAHFYTASVGTLRPSDLRNPGAEWTHMGNTSLEDIVAISSEGGETTTLGTLQNKQARNSTTPRIEAFTINLMQFDEQALKLYYGANAVVENGMLEVPSEPVATEAAWLAVLYDGNNNAGFIAAKAEIFRSDDLSISDTESLAMLPLRVTPLSVNGGSPYKFIIPHLDASAGRDSTPESDPDGA